MTPEQAEDLVLTPGARQNGWRLVEVLRERRITRTPHEVVVIISAMVCGPNGRPRLVMAIAMEFNGTLRARARFNRLAEIEALADAADELANEAAGRRRRDRRSA